MAALKAKLRSTEFWLSLLAIVVGGLVGSGAIAEGTIYAKIGGWLIAALGSAGYTAGRTLAKAGSRSKAGFKTTEFWEAIAAAVLVWIQAHALPESSAWAEPIGMALTLLPVSAYTVARGSLKRTGGSQ